VHTDDLMALALQMAGMDETPPDCGVYVPGRDITRVLFGIDVTVGDLLLAADLGCDCVIAHHYTGTPARVTAWKRYLTHIDQMTQWGVPVEEARAAVLPRAKALEVEFHMDNYDQVSSAARHLGMPFLNIHSPLDEIGRVRMQEAVDALLDQRPEVSAGEMAGVLAALPIVRSARTEVQLRIGKPENPAGRAVVSHGALRNGGAAVARAYFRHGVSTVIYIHLNPSDYAELKNNEAEGNVIVVGHIAADSFGIIPYVEELRGRGIEVLLSGGLLDDAGV